MHPTLTLVCAALALAGCAGLASLPARDATVGALPVLTPPAGSTLQPALAIDRWWTLFGDVTLAARMQLALDRNHDLAIAAERVREARARLDELRGSQGPALDLQAQSGRSRGSADLGAPSGPASRHQAALAGRYELDLWGALASADRAARERLLAQEWARASVQWSLTAQVAEAHFGLRAVQRQLELATQMRTAREHTLALQQRGHAAGVASEFELRRAESELAATESTLAGLRRQQAGLQRTLALLIGQSPAELASALDAEPLDTALALAAPLPQGPAAELLQRRPDLRQAEAELAATRADVAAARAATLPALRLSGSVGSDVRSLSSLFDGPGFVWSLAGSLTASVFDGGAGRARIEQADARAAMAQAGYRRAVLGALLELREAYAALETTQQAQQAEQRRSSALEQARRLAERGVAAGALNRLDLLDAERNAFQAQLAEVDATRDRLLSQVAAYKSLGGGHTPI